MPTQETKQHVLALVKIEEHLTTKDTLKSIEQVTAGTLDARQLVGAFRDHVVRNPELIKCTPTSVAKAIANAGRLGLNTDPTLRQVALVPLWNKHVGATMCNLWIQYAGWIQLVKKAGIVKIDSQVVLDGDQFDYAYGTDEFLKHKPGPAHDEIIDSKDPLKLVTHAYAICTFANGMTQFRVIAKTKLKKYMQMSGRGDGDISHFWRQWPYEQCEAKAIKQLAKKLEAATESPLLQRAVGLDDEVDAGVPQAAPSADFIDASEPAAALEEARSEKAEKVIEQSSQIDPRIPLAWQQRIKELAVQARVSPEEVTRAMVDVLREADSFTEAEAQKKFIQLRLTGLAKEYQSAIEAKAQKKQKAKPDAPPAPVKKEDFGEHPWMADEKPPEDSGDPPTQESGEEWDWNEVTGS